MRSASEINRDIWSAKVPDPGVLAESRLRRVAEVLEHHPPGALLDVACGPAFFTGRLAEYGWDVVGVEQAGSLAQAAHERIPVVCSDVGTAGFPFAAQVFDVVFAGEIIEHVVDTDRFLGEIQRVLRPGGVAIVTTPNLASFENRCRLLLGRYPKWVDFRSSGEGHVRAYTAGALREQLADHGFITRSVKGNWVPFLPQRVVDDVRAPWLARTGDWFPTLAMDIILEAQKI